MTLNMHTVFLLLGLVATAFAAHEDTRNVANPIRRVVTLLQKMQKSVETEGDKEKKLFQEFMCYCKTGTGDLTKSITAAENKIPQVESALAEAEASKTQLEKDLAQHKANVADAKKTIASATSLREKEAAAFAKESSDLKTNIAALAKAIAALEAGTAGSFLQNAAATTVLQRLTVDVDMSSADREMLTAFLSQSQGYAPQSGQIIGILKQMKDTMEATLADVTAAEEEAIKNFDALMAAKKKEVEANTAAIESKLERVGQVGLDIVEMKEDLDDTAKALAEDKKFLAELEKGCATKEAEWADRCKIRADELLALCDTIKILNDDDALDLFKKTLPSASFLQVNERNMALRHRALAVLQAVQLSRKTPQPRLDFIALALRDKNSGTFDKVIGMIDEMVGILAEEQTADDDKKAYCEAELDKTEDTKKSLERKVDDLGAALEDTKGMIATLTEEIAALVEGIEALDKAVAEATENRKAENVAYKELMAADTAAEQLLSMAGNRLAKFYTPKLYVPPAKTELSAEQRIAVNMGSEAAPTEAPMFAQIKQHDAASVAPPPPPETWGAYKKKGEEHGGVVAMINMLKADLEKEMQSATVEEKDAQSEYEKMMAESAEKRATDSKSVADKESAKADLESKSLKLKEEETATMTEVLAAAETLKNLHLECDWLVSNFEVRKEARAGEVEALKKAKAVLSGADYSLIQTGRSSLRGA
jgi:septal ring factor EnvC (AmiA/AmiB activator)